MEYTVWDGVIVKFTGHEEANELKDLSLISVPY